MLHLFLEPGTTLERVSTKESEQKSDLKREREKKEEEELIFALLKKL